MGKSEKARPGGNRTGAMPAKAVGSSNKGKHAKFPRKGLKPTTTTINPFDQVANKRQKFQVLNKRGRGEVRNVARARQNALERRRNTLLVEHEANKKVNQFKDRRFGEDDPSLSLEEKMMIRFQRERQKKARKSVAGLFHLDDGGDEDEEGGELLLTHKGKALHEVIGQDDFQDDINADSDEDDGRLDARMVKDLHFGGGGASGGRGLKAVEEDGKKSRRDLIDEMIQRSKTQKALKAKLKGAQEEQLDRLDAGFGDLMSELTFRKPGPVGRVEGNDDEYDALFSEMHTERFAARATDRTKTEEEIAKEEKERLDELEAARLARMLGEGDEKDEDEKEKKGGKKRRRNDEELSDDEEEAKPVLDLDTLREHYEAAMKQKKGKEGQEEDEEESEGDEDEDEDGSDDDDDDDDEEEEEGSGEDDEEEDEDDEEDDDEEEEESGSEEEEEDEKARKDQPATKKHKEDNAAVTVTSLTGGEINPDMPYVLECPRSMEQFSELVKTYARSAADVKELIERIRRYHAIRVNEKNREKMHNFYDLLLRRLIKVGDYAVQGKKGGVINRFQELEAIGHALMDITPEMVEVASNLWVRLLKTLDARLHKSLRDHELGQAVSCFPSPGALLLFRLLGHIFPTTDFRHPVVTPAFLFMTQALTTCPVSTPWDLKAGLFLSSLLLEFTSKAKRVMPEVMAFLTAAAAALMKPPCAVGSVGLTTFDPAFNRRLKAAWEEETSSGSNDELSLPFLKSGTEEDVVVPAIAVVLNLAKRYAEVHLAGSAASSEALEPLLARLTSWEPASPPALVQAYKDTVEVLRESSSKCRSGRRPLVWLTVKVDPIKQLMPKMETGKKRELTTEQETRQLQRELKREKKGAMRELRLDSEFLEAEKVRQQREKEEAKKKQLRANMAWLEQQQATINHQVRQQKGVMLHGGGSGIKKAMLGTKKKKE